MTDPVRNEYAPDFVSPPGATLAEILGERGMTQADLAERMGRPKKTISEIVTGKAAITPETALQLERVLGISATFWNARESNYRESLARAEENAQLAKYTLWVRSFPLSSMTKVYGVPQSRDPVDRVREVLGFFGVASVEQWKTMVDAQQTRLRAPNGLRAKTPALAAWLRQGEILGQQKSCVSYNPEAFRSALAEVRAQTRERPEVFSTHVQDLCARSGVAVAFVPEISGVHVSGAARWLSSTKALIQLSLRYRTDDQLWFSFFHEAAHLLLHGKRQVFVDVDSSETPEEREADRFAADLLIPPERYAAFRSEGNFSKASITRFAKAIGIAPGIVVGRLQHDRLLAFSQCNELKRRLEWTAEDKAS